MRGVFPRVCSAGPNRSEHLLTAYGLRISHKCVPLFQTLSHESTGCSAIEGLWGTLDSWPDRLRGKTGGEGRGGVGGLYPPAIAQPCNSETPSSGREKEGPYRAVGPSPVQSIAVYCSRLQGRRRKYALFLTPAPLCQRGGRRFEPGLVLQKMRTPSAS
jgi:hypothetical protein